MPPKIFKPSQVLADLLIKHGFTELTQKLYPSHYKRIKEQGYDPYSMKRIFSHRLHQDFILFRYAYVTIHHQGDFYHTEERRVLTTNELRSIIAFYKLPQQTGREWLDAYTNALELHRYYTKICTLPEVFNSPPDMVIKETFEAVLIPAHR